MMTTTETPHHVESSGEDSQLSSPPHSTPEPGSPSAQIANDSALHQNQTSITVNPPITLGQSGEPEKPARKKPGRKPGWNKPKEQNAADSSATNTDAPRKRAPRKPRDPNAPPVQRRKRKTASLEASSVQAPAGPPRAEIQPRPSAEFKVPPENTSEKGKNEAIPRFVIRTRDFFIFKSAKRILRSIPVLILVNAFGHLLLFLHSSYPCCGLHFLLYY
jgi:hypothetical protein